MVRNGFFWFVAWFVMVFFGLAWLFLVCSTVRNGFFGLAWFSVVRNGFFWFSLVFFCLDWFSVVCSGFGENTQNHYKPTFWHYKPKKTSLNHDSGTTNHKKPLQNNRVGFTY